MLKVAPIIALFSSRVVSKSPPVDTALEGTSPQKAAETSHASLIKSPVETALPLVSKVVDIVKKEAAEDVEAIKAAKKPLDLRKERFPLTFEML
jgi:hypothetical protein